jgi:uncharacterized membrane protein
VGRRERLLEQLATQPLVLVDQILDLEERLRASEEKLAEAQALIAELRRQLFGPKAEKLSPEQQAQIDQLANDLREEAQQPSPLSREVLEEERRDQGKRRAQRRPPRHALPAVLETQTVTLGVGAGVREQHFCRFDRQQPHRRGRGTDSERRDKPARSRE